LQHKKTAKRMRNAARSPFLPKSRLTGFVFPRFAVLLSPAVRRRFGRIGTFLPARIAYTRPRSARFARPRRANLQIIYTHILPRTRKV